MSKRGSATLLLLLPLSVAWDDCNPALPDEHPVIGTHPEHVEALRADYPAFLPMLAQYNAREPVEFVAGGRFFRVLEGVRLGVPDLVRLNAARWEPDAPVSPGCAKEDGIGRMHLEAEIRVKKRKTAVRTLTFELCGDDDGLATVKLAGEATLDHDPQRVALAIQDGLDWVFQVATLYESDVDRRVAEILDGALGCPLGSSFEHKLDVYYCVGTEGERSGPWRKAASEADFLAGRFQTSGQYVAGVKQGTWITLDAQGEAVETVYSDGQPAVE